jgi:hypothetical protein
MDRSYRIALLLASARCVTNSTLDNTLHPNVGTIVAEYLTPGVKNSACTGTLISPQGFPDSRALHCPVTRNVPCHSGMGHVRSGF